MLLTFAIHLQVYGYLFSGVRKNYKQCQAKCCFVLSHAECTDSPFSFDFGQSTERIFVTKIVWLLYELSTTDHKKTSPTDAAKLRQTTDFNE